MRKIIPSVALVILLALSGCVGNSPPAAKAYRYPDTPGGRLCTSQCRSVLERGQEACRYKERSCVMEKQTQAIKDYESYAQEQYRAHLPVELRPRDFESVESCIPSACLASAEELYDQCFEKCGGTIMKPEKADK